MSSPQDLRRLSFISLCTLKWISKEGAIKTGNNRVRTSFSKREYFGRPSLSLQNVPLNIWVEGFSLAARYELMPVKGWENSTVSKVGVRIRVRQARDSLLLWVAQTANCSHLDLWRWGRRRGKSSTNNPKRLLLAAVTTWMTTFTNHFLLRCWGHSLDSRPSSSSSFGGFEVQPARAKRKPIGYRTHRVLRPVTKSARRRSAEWTGWDFWEENWAIQLRCNATEGQTWSWG